MDVSFCGTRGWAQARNFPAEVLLLQADSASARKIVLVVIIMAGLVLGKGSGIGWSFCGTGGWAQAISLQSCFSTC